MATEQQAQTEGMATHGRSFTATVIAARAQKTAVVEFERRYHVPKYERYERRSTKLAVHNPETINAKPGDIVRIMECRPISKTKHFIITEKLGTERLFAERAALLEASKVKAAEKRAKAEAKDKEAAQ